MEDYHEKVVEFRALLRDQLENRLINGEREGHTEDLLMMTILDPRFKNIDFKGSTGTKFVSSNLYYILLAPGIVYKYINILFLL